MPHISLNQFRTIAPTLGPGERVKVGTVADGTKGLKATDNFGTKATR